MTKQLKVEVTLEESVFTVVIGGGATAAPVTLVFPPTKLATGLGDIGMLLRATGGEVTPTLRVHFMEHFGNGQYGLGACGFCKLQGKVLAAQGRRPLRTEEIHAAAKVVPQGKTAWGELRAKEDREVAAERREARRPHLAAPARRSLVEVLF